MKNNEQNQIPEEPNIESSPILTEQISGVFKKASEFNLTPEEKNKGVADFKEFMNKNSSKINTSSESPYSQYIISTTAFFGNFSKQFNSAFNTKKVGTFVYAHRKKIAQASLIACFVFIFAAGTATAANSSLPGDLLYPIKIKINEPIESALAVGPREKAKVAVKHAVERVKEASELSLAGKISSENENAINTEITERSEEARRSIINLKTYGNADVANDITVDFENSVSVYKRNIEAFSKFNSAPERNDTLKRVINTLDGEIQKISNPSINDFGDKGDRHRDERTNERNRSNDRGRSTRDSNNINEVLEQEDKGSFFQKYEKTSTTSLPIVTGTISPLVTATTSITSTTEVASSSSQIIQTQSTSPVSVDTTVSPALIPTVQTSVSIPSTIVTPSIQINLK